MIQFAMPLDKITQRPVTYLYNWHGLKAMIDTGSLFPVWVGEEKLLPLLGGKLLKSGVKFGGFGGDTKGNLYQMQIFQFGELLFPCFHIIAHKMNLPCQLILPATMFQKLRYEVDSENYVFNVTIPDKQSNVRNLIIEDNEGQLHVLCTSKDI